MTDKQQTAVQWLYKQLNSSSTNNTFIKPKLIQQALEMEREQIINAQMDMFLHMIQTPYGLEYLNQREEAYTFAERYFTNTYKTKP